jgi:hypothetical protein
VWDFWRSQRRITTVTKRLLFALVAAATAAAVIGSLVVQAGPSNGATRRASTRPGYTVSRASVILLMPSSTQPLLRVSRLGLLSAHCGHAGQATTSFRVLPQALSALTVVQTTGRSTRNTFGSHLLAPTPSRGTGEQVWQIAPITSENPPSTPVATITVAMSHYPPSHGCVVSAHSRSTNAG